MRKTIGIALVGAALLGGAVTASAQQGQGQGQGPGRQGGQARMMEMMFKGIELSADQKTKVDSVMAAYRTQMPQMTPGTPPSEEDRAKRRELQTKQQADVRAVLTAEQQKTFDTNMTEMRNMGRGGGGRPPA